MPICNYCGGPVTGPGHTGRPWPGRAAKQYCCFGCLSLGEQHEQEAGSTNSQAGGRLDLGVRLGIGLLVVGQSMIFGLALNLHDDVPSQVRWLAQTLILCATLLVVVLLGGPLVTTAWRELRRGRLTIEALFLLTMTGAMAASLQAHLTGRGKIYFEVVSILLVVYTFGKLIGARSRAAALAHSRAWAGQLETCRLIDASGQSRIVPVTQVRPGDRVDVNPGETIAIDGVICEGTGFVSEAPVSGEPFAVVRRSGDRVLAGSASYDASFVIEATAPGTERQVDQLLAAVEDARRRPASLQAQADAVGRWFLPLVVLTALGTFAFWTARDGWEAGLFNAMSVLLVACPCVIGLATPIIIWSALARLAERGLIARSGEAIERLAAVDRVLFDKTGTLTDEEFALVDIATRATGDDRSRLLGWLSVIEERSSHPVARPFAKLPRPAGDEARISTLRAVPGCGVEAVIESLVRQHLVQIGTPQWIASVSRALASVDSGSRLTDELRGAGHVVHVALDGDLAAVAVLAERLRESSRQSLAEFKRLGLPVEVLTGDRLERAQALELPGVCAGLLPDDKRAAAAVGKALFVGDGINDASALAAAHVGVALSSGTDLAVGASDVALYHGDLRVLPWAVEYAREAVRAVRRSLYRALAYNLAGMTLAACGVLHPVGAALLMVASSLTLVFCATRVGVPANHCEPKARSVSFSRAGWHALTHGLAFALQGIVVLLLLEAARPAVIAAALATLFALTGSLLAYLWFRKPALPHALDMAFGMITLGNLGMLGGWWADNGFAPLQDRICCASAEAMQPWMWIGMLIGANVAMFGLGRNVKQQPARHRVAMLTGGNAAMVLGMLAGGLAAAQVPTASVPLGFSIHFVGMTVGMIAGMLAGTWMVEKGIVAARSLRLLPRWLRAGSKAKLGQAGGLPYE